MKLIRSRLGRGIDSRAIPGEFSAVGVRQRLELGDSLNAERSARHRGAAAALPPVQAVFAIQQVSITLGPRTRNRERRAPADQRRLLAGGIGLRPGSEQDELLDVAPV